MNESQSNPVQVQIEAQRLRDTHTELAESTAKFTEQIAPALESDTGNIQTAIDAQAKWVGYNPENNAQPGESYKTREARAPYESNQLRDAANEAKKDVLYEQNPQETGLERADLEHGIDALAVVQHKAEYNDASAEQHYRENMGTYQELGQQAATAAGVELNLPSEQEK